MVIRAINLIAVEWKVSSVFLMIILFLVSLSVSVFSDSVIKIVLFLVGLEVYNWYFVYLGKTLGGARVQKPFAFSFIWKDKSIQEAGMLLLLFGAIILLWQGPRALISFLFPGKISELLGSLGHWALLIQIVMLFVICLYKVCLYSAFASVTYHRHEALESFKTGVKGIWRFKGLLLILILIEIGYSVIGVIPSSAIRAAVNLVSYIVPAVFICLMSCSYSMAVPPTLGPPATSN